MYNRTTKDLIFARSVGNLNGYGSILENIGTSSNKGVEIGLNTVNISKKDFTWKTNLTFSLNRNKIVDLYGDKKDDLANRWFIGQPMKVIYDLEKVGISDNRGVRTGTQFDSDNDYIVIKQTNMTSLIIEMGFISNENDVELYDDNMDDYAAAIANGIIEWLNEYQ